LLKIEIRFNDFFFDFIKKFTSAYFLRKFKLILLALPIFTIIFDYTENFLVTISIISFDKNIYWRSTSAWIFNDLKWLFMGASAFATAFLWLFRLKALENLFVLKTNFVAPTVKENLMSDPINFKTVLEQERKHLGLKEDDPASALCISGGGIRSATFALGVIEVLAKRGLLDKLDYLSTVSGGGYIGSWLTANRLQAHAERVEDTIQAIEAELDRLLILDRKNEQADEKTHNQTQAVEQIKKDIQGRVEILGKLRSLREKFKDAEEKRRTHFTQLIKKSDQPTFRDCLEKFNDSENQNQKLLRDELQEITKSTKTGKDISFQDILKKPKRENEPEQYPVRYLRAFSNYMTPRFGLFSADTWTIFSTYLRNLTLNWLVLIPAMVGALLLPRLLFSISVGLHAPHMNCAANLSLPSQKQFWLSGGVGCIPLPYFLWLGLGSLSGIWGIGVIGKNQPVDKHSTDGQRNYLIYCLLPLLISAFSLTTFGAHIYLLFGKNSKDIFPCFQFIIFGIFFHLGGWLLGWGFYLRQRKGITPNLETKPSFVLSLFGVIATGAIGGFLTWFVLCFLFDKWEPFFKNGTLIPTSYLPALYFCLATPVFIGLLGLVGIIHAGITTKCTSDQSQEWLARSGAWMTIGCLGWIGISGIVFFGPPLLVWLKVLMTGFLLGGSGGLATLLGKSSKTSANAENEKGAKTWTSILTDNAAAFAAPVFIILFLSTLSFASNWMIYGVQNFAAQSLENNPLFYAVKFPQTPVGYDSMMLLLTNSSWGVITIALVAMVIVSVILCLFLDINRYSMHGLYRNRLVRAYLGASRGKRRNPNPFTGFDPDDDFPIGFLRDDLTKTDSDDLAAKEAPTVQKPLHIVNCALNLVGGKNLAWQQRKAMSFTISPLHSGSCLLEKNSAALPDTDDISIPNVSGCYRDSLEYGKGISLGTAVGISGAAASPNMGYHSSPTVTFLLTLFNVRLGWWLGNPGGFSKRQRFYLRFIEYLKIATPSRFEKIRYKRLGDPLSTDSKARKELTQWLGQSISNVSTLDELQKIIRETDDNETYRKGSPSFFLGTLVKELFGLTDANSDFVNLSDGGHFENLALYEMVLRRCRLIIVSDAGADPDYVFEDLGNAVRKINVDQGIPIRFKEIPIYSRHDKEVTNRQYFAVGEIDYSAMDNGPSPKGYLLYLKPTLLTDDGAVPADVRNYAAAHKEFPHQSTGDQFFDESQFESYRALGEYAAGQALSSLGLGVSGEITILTLAEKLKGFDNRLDADTPKYGGFSMNLNISSKTRT
jgi:hypothetical protein